MQDLQVLQANGAGLKEKEKPLQVQRKKNKLITGMRSIVLWSLDLEEIKKIIIKSEGGFGLC